MQEKGKKGGTKATPFPNSNCWSPLICLDAAQLSRSFVSLAATSPSHKALWEWCVTRCANKNCKSLCHQEPPEARMWPIKTVPGLLCSNPCLCPEIFHVFCIWCFLKKKLQYNGKHELLHWSQWLCPKNHFNCVKYWDIHTLRSIDYKPLKW